MTINTDQLIIDLIEKTQLNIKEAENFYSLSIHQLNDRQKQDSWTILECLQHLNLYGDFYIPEIKKRIEQTKTQPSHIFKSGIIGGYFVKSISLKAELNKMKTPQDKNPIGSALDKSTIDNFIAQQEQLLSLLQKSKNVNLNKIKTNISLSKLIKLKLGDTLRFVIHHNERHIHQANKTLEK